MFVTRFLALFAVAVLMCANFAPVWAGEKGEDMIIIGGEHGCGPKMLLKSGGKKKGDILVMGGDCKKKHKQTHYIPYPVYHGGYGGGHEGGYGGY